MGIIKEACPLGLTPSSSIAVMSAISDSIALTLMELKEVTKEESEENLEEIDEEPGIEIETAEIKSISAEAVYEIIQNGEDYLIVDVRTQEEYDEGHIEGALLLPVKELEDRLNELPKDKPIIVYCRSGNRSRTAAEILINNGFTKVYLRELYQ